MSYENKSKLAVSEKGILAHLEPSKRLVLWELDTGAVYKKVVDYYLIDLKIDQTSLSEHSNKFLSPGQWFFDYATKTVYVRLSDDSNPHDSFISGIFRLFFSNVPAILTHNLTGGNEVYYEPIIESTSAFKQQIDNAEQLGISLESEGSISFKNKDGFFDNIFDKLFFENKDIKIYSWFPDTEETEAQKVFEGIIENKGFDTEKVNFVIKDFIFKLRQPVKLNRFTQSDGVISDDVVGNNFKRRLYGKVKGARCQSLDMILGGFELTGTINASTGTTVITGTGTEFLKECSPDDKLFIALQFETLEFKIDSIQSDTQLTVSEEFEVNISNGTTATIQPERTPYKNREYFVSDHKLRQPSANATEGIQFNRIRFNLADLEDFFEGDNVIINGEDAKIKRISGDTVILFQALDLFPQAGWTMIKNPIDAVYFNGDEYLIDRDYTFSNAADCKITFNKLAEFNVSKQKNIQGSVTFTNGARNISGSGTNFKTDFRSRDFIRSTDVFNPDWFEVLEIIDDENLIIRENYTGLTQVTPAQKKNIDYIKDDSVITVDCIGKEDSTGKWIKTASDVVLDLMDDAGLANLDLDSFDESKIKADYTVSMKLPLSFDDSEPPSIREVVSMLNKSVFGSLTSRTNFDVAFDVLTPDRPEDLTELKDDDLIEEPRIKTITDIKRKIIGQFSHFDADRYTGKSGHDTVDYENSFVDNLIGSKQEKTVELYLFNEVDAQTICERYALIHSLTQSVVTVKSKLNLTLKNLNDKIWISLDRLYYRFGASNDRKKVGIISSIQRKFNETTVSFSDLSNQFNRVGAIAPDDSVEFTLASDTDKIKNGYIVDNSTELPSNDDDSNWNTNLIG